MVLLVSYSGGFGGAERLLVQLAPELRGVGALACPEGELSRQARAAGLRVFPLRSRRPDVRTLGTDRLLSPFRLLGFGLEVRRLIRALAPELTIAWGMRSIIVLAMPRRWHGRLIFQHNDVLPGPLIALIVRRAAAEADAVFALSETIARDLDPDDRLGDRLAVLRPGIDVARFDPDAPPAEPPEVLVLGALARWKRPDLALEAMSIARRTIPRLRLRMAGPPIGGDGEQFVQTLRERAARPDLAGAVDLLGPVPHPEQELARARCLLHCAPREPFGMAVLECLAAGRPAVVPAAAGPAEIVDESCAVLYEPGNAAAAASAIVEVVSAERRAASLGAAGRARARAAFDLDESRGRYMRALGGFMNGARAERRSFALLTVTHNSSEWLPGLLASVERHLPDARVIVVDSGSSDDTVALARGFACVSEAVALGDNVGFAAACNRGVELVEEPVTALLNPDVELIDDSLHDLVRMAARPDLPERLFAPAVLYPDGRPQDSVHPAPASAADLVRTVVAPAVLPDALAAPLAPWRSSRPRRVGWAVGCALVARTDTLRRLGPFDEGFFLYGEDLDLGLRAAASGIETWFWPTARVLHHRAHSTSRSFDGEPFELLAATRHRALVRCLGTRRARLDTASQAVTFSSRLVVKRALGRSAARERRQLAALRRVL